MTYDQAILAICLWREARSHPEAYTAIKHVIWNRAAKKRQPYHQIILAPKQFSSFNSNDPNAVKWPVNDGDADWAAFLRAMMVAQDGESFDPTGGANHYHSYTKEEQYPKWAQGVKPTLVVGPFRFYKL